MASPTVAQAKHLYLHGPAVDQVLADDAVGTANDDVLWLLADHEGTIRDIVGTADNGALSAAKNHITYDSYGNRLSERDAAVDTLFGYTGRPFDEETGLQENRRRYYDPKLGRFLSQDPSGFSGGDANLYRYASNSPLVNTDPSGLASIMFGQPGNFGGGRATPWATSTLSGVLPPFANFGSGSSYVGSNIPLNASNLLNWTPPTMTSNPFAPVTAAPKPSAAPKVAFNSAPTNYNIETSTLSGLNASPVSSQPLSFDLNSALFDTSIFVPNIAGNGGSQISQNFVSPNIDLGDLLSSTPTSILPQITPLPQAAATVTPKQVTPVVPTQPSPTTAPVTLSPITEFFDPRYQGTSMVHVPTSSGSLQGDLNALNLIARDMAVNSDYGLAPSQPMSEKQWNQLKRDDVYAKTMSDIKRMSHFGVNNPALQKELVDRANSIYPVTTQAWLDQREFEQNLKQFGSEAVGNMYDGFDARQQSQIQVELHRNSLRNPSNSRWLPLPRPAVPGGGS